jgi:hypothetical protein
MAVADVSTPAKNGSGRESMFVGHDNPPGRARVPAFAQAQGRANRYLYAFCIGPGS